MMDEAAKEAERQRKLMVGEQLKTHIDQRNRILQDQKRQEQMKDYENL
jgi:hypothetical protein